MKLLRPSSLAELDGGLLVHGGTEVVPLLRDGILQADTLVDVRGIVPRGVRDGIVGAGATLAALEIDPQTPVALPPVEASVYLKAMDRKRWSFPQVGVAAARTSAGMRIALAGVAPIPWLLGGPEDVDRATPLPRTTWKVDVARALVARAVAQI